MKVTPVNEVYNGMRRTKGREEYIIYMSCCIICIFDCMYNYIFPCIRRRWDRKNRKKEISLISLWSQDETQSQLFDRIENENKIDKEDTETPKTLILEKQQVSNPVFDMQNQYEIQALKVSVLQKESEYTILSQKYDYEKNELQKSLLKIWELESQNDNLISKIRWLELWLLESERNSEKTASDNFLIHLWRKVKESCENATTEVKKSSCNSLYFNFIK